MSFVDEIKQHKTLAIVAGTATLGAIAYSFMHKGSSSSSAGSNSVTSAGTGGSVPVQYLVPYSSYPSAGGAPNSGSTGTSSGGTTTTTSTSPSGIASSGGSGAGSGGTTSVSVPQNNPAPTPSSISGVTPWGSSLTGSGSQYGTSGQPPGDTLYGTPFATGLTGSALTQAQNAATAKYGNHYLTSQEPNGTYSIFTEG